MKRKFLAILLTGLLALSICACGDNGKQVESEKEVKTANEQTSNPDDSNVGEIIEENGMRKEPVVTEKKLNKTGETGPIKYKVEGLQISKLTATTDEMAQALDIEKDKEVAVIAVNLSAENTSEQDISFYLGQAVLTTNTKEQVEPSLIASDYIEGEYFGKVRHSGMNAYILEHSSAEDITNISLRISAPSDANFENVGEDVKIDFEIN